MAYTKNTNQDKQTIAQILPSMEGGGVERDTFHTAIAIKEAGYNSIVISEGGVLADRLQRYGVTHITLPVATKNPFKIYLNHFLLMKVIKKYHINLIHARSRAPAYSAYFAAKKTGTKFFTTFHGCHKLGMMGMKRIYNSIMTKGDKVIAVSDFVKDYVTKNYDISPEKITVIKDGVDLSIFSPEKVSAERKIKILHDFDVDDDKKIIVLPSRLSAIKGQDVFINAIAKLKEKRADFVCVLIGKAKEKYKKKLISMIKHLNLGEFVKIKEQSNDMPAVYMCSNIVVSSSLVPEAFGLTIAEAEAMGRIVIAPDFGGTAEIVNHEIDGFLYKMGDVEALESLLDKALSLPLDKRKEISSKAIDNIKNNFTIEISSRDMILLYRDALNKI